MMKKDKKDKRKKKNDWKFSQSYLCMTLFCFVVLVVSVCIYSFLAQDSNLITDLGRTQTFFGC